MKSKSFNFGFIGVGQGGCNIANTFRKMGYSDCVFLNTAKVDLDGLDAPEEQKLLIGDHADGAGKNPEEGLRAAKLSEEHIRERIQDLISCDKVFVCIGSGGGTGSGAGPLVIEIARDLGRIGVIATLPSKAEIVSDKVKSNALQLLTKVCDDVDQGSLFPLIVIDNQLMREVAPIRSFRTMWEDGNSYGCGIIDVFNTLSATPTFLPSVDKNDVKGILDRPGTLFMGQMQNNHPMDKQQTSRAISKSFTTGMFLHSDSDTSESDCACVMTLPQKVLDESVAVFDLIMTGINGVLDSVPGGNIHKGFYEEESSTKMMIFTMSIGDASPRGAVLDRLT